MQIFVVLTVMILIHLHWFLLNALLEMLNMENIENKSNPLPTLREKRVVMIFVIDDIMYDQESKFGAPLEESTVLEELFA